MTGRTWRYLLIIWTLIFWIVVAVAIARADDRCPPPTAATAAAARIITPRFAAMAGVQMDLNVNSLQVGAALTQDGQAAALGKRFCFSPDKCGFFGLNAGFDDYGESYTFSTTWVIK